MPIKLKPKLQHNLLTKIPKAKKKVVMMKTLMISQKLWKQTTMTLRLT